MDVNKKVELLINYKSCSDDTPFDDEYQSTFGGEGVRKSKYILDALSTNQEVSKENLSEYIFVSIGGADGSEAEEILKNTDIEKSIMVEISDHASAKARERALYLKNTLGKELIIIQGDVTQRLPDVIKCMKKFKKNCGLTGLILSIQAVLHELPRRSPNYRSGVLFGQLFSVFSKNIYFGREPIKVERWPDIVDIKVGNASSENLSKLAEIINDKLSITDLPVTPIANGFINVDSKLAIELLHKLIRPRSVSQFAYELGEQLTSVDPDILKKTIESHIGKATITIESTITEGFKEAWKLHSVEVKNEQGDPLSYPNTHARLVGFSLPSEHTPSNTKCGHNKETSKALQPKSEINPWNLFGKPIELSSLSEGEFWAKISDDTKKTLKVRIILPSGRFKGSIGMLPLVSDNMFLPEVLVCIANLIKEAGVLLDVQTLFDIDVINEKNGNIALKLLHLFVTGEAKHLGNNTTDRNIAAKIVNFSRKQYPFPLLDAGKTSPPMELRNIDLEGLIQGHDVRE